VLASFGVFCFGGGCESSVFEGNDECVGVLHLPTSYGQIDFFGRRLWGSGVAPSGQTKQNLEQLKAYLYLLCENLECRSGLTGVATGQRGL